MATTLAKSRETFRVEALADHDLDGFDSGNRELDRRLTPA